MSDHESNTPPATGWKTFGHDAAVRMLNSANSAGMLAHAYLVTGPDRVGRKTLAIDIACLVNCDPQPDLFGEAPVLDLESCPAGQRIRKGQHADVRVIDRTTPIRDDSSGSGGGDSDGPGRQSISINHVHDLQRDASLKPFEGKARVFILDGAELLSAPAANALLKTLEEPSEDVYILLIAPDAESLPETIVSRCQAIRLKPVNAETIADALVERFEAEPEQAERLARLSAGRPGWAIAALQDPAILEIYTQTATRILSALSGGLEERFSYASELSARFRRDRDGVLGELRRWLEWWRDLAVMKAGLLENVINADWNDALSGIADQLSEEEITSGANSVLSTTEALEANAIPRLALEVMMLEMPTPKAVTTGAPANR